MDNDKNDPIQQSKNDPPAVPEKPTSRRQAYFPPATEIQNLFNLKARHSHHNWDSLTDLIFRTLTNPLLKPCRLGASTISCSKEFHTPIMPWV